MYHFILNATSSEDRRKLMIEEFKKINIPEPNFFPAIMGNKLSEEELNQLVNKSCTLTLGEIGCALSHLAMYREFLKTTEPSVFIFEDDIRFTELVTNDLLQQAKKFVDVQDKPTVLLLRPARFMLSKQLDLDNDVSIHKVKEVSTTFAYIINRAAAENILKLQQPLKFIIDGWRHYTLLNILQAYCLNKHIIEHDFLPSLINKMKNRTKRATKKEAHYVINDIIATLPKEEQKRIKQQKIIRTFERIKCILSGRKNMNKFTKS